MRARVKLYRFFSLPPDKRWLFVQALMGLTFTAVALRLAGFQRIVALLRRLTPALSGSAVGQTVSLPMSSEQTLGGDMGKLTVCPTVSDEVKAVTRIRAIYQMVHLAARHCPVTAQCLPQSLVLWWLLRRAGVASELRIGVRKQAGRLEAHAWVELSGWSLNQPGDGQASFTPFDRPIIPVGAKSQVCQETARI